jgi:hypothetical protein
MMRVTARSIQSAALVFFLAPRRWIADAQPTTNPNAERSPFGSPLSQLEHAGRSAAGCGQV